jgi:hypothetical protein
VSIEDADMRHGRKSKSKRFNGYKQHVGTDLDTEPCPLRANCTEAATGRGRSITMGDNEPLQKKLRTLQHTRAGREVLRERVGVEHRLAHLANRQGPRARYRGTRKNLADLRRLSVVQNLETIARRSSDTATVRYLPRAA